MSSDDDDVDKSLNDFLGPRKGKGIAGSNSPLADVFRQSQQKKSRSGMGSHQSIQSKKEELMTTLSAAPTQVTPWVQSGGALNHVLIREHFWGLSEKIRSLLLTLFHSSIKTLDAKYLEKKSGAASPNTNTNVANFLQTVLRSCPLLNKPNAIAHALEQSPQLQPLVLQIIHTFMQSQKQVIYLLDVFFSLQATKENGLSQMVVVWTDPFLVLQFFLHRCLQELIRTLEENERISLGTLESLPTLHLPSAPVPPPVSHAVQEEIVHKIWNSMIHEWAFIPYPLENVGVVYATKIEREKQAQAGYIKYLSLDSLSHRDNGSLLSFLDRFAKPVISPVAKSLMSAMAEISVRLEKIEEMMHVCLKAKNDKTTTTATTTTAPATAATTTTSVAEILRLTMNPSSNDPKSLTQGPLIPPETKSTGSDKTKVENRVTPRGPQELGLVNSGSRKDTGSKIESLGKKNEKSTPPTTSAPTSIATSLAASSANNNKAPDAREAMEAYLKKLNRKDLLPELKR